MLELLTGTEMMAAQMLHLSSSGGPSGALVGGALLLATFSRDGERTSKKMKLLLKTSNCLNTTLDSGSNLGNSFLTSSNRATVVNLEDC